MTSKSATKRSLQNTSYYCYIICNIYLLITGFKGRIVNYGPRFFHFNLLPGCEARGS